MIYALKLLVAVSVLAGLAAYLFRGASKNVMAPADYKRAWTLVLLGVGASYLCKFPVLFLLVLAVIALYGASAMGRGPVGKVAVYLLLACTLPPINVVLGGFGGINYVLDVDHLRLTAVLLLGWAALELVGTKHEPRTVSFFWIDLLVVVYQVLRILLIVPHSSATTLLRATVEATMDILLPYFVISRSLRSIEDIRFIAGNFLIGLTFAAMVGLGEALLQHNLYSGLQGIYDVRWQLTYELKRGNLLRVQSVTPTPIILGFMMLFGLGMTYLLRGAQWRRGLVLSMFGVMLITLFATFSRGMWLAAGIMGLTLIAMHRLASTGFRVLLVAAVFAVAGLKLAHADEFVMSALGALFGSGAADMSSIEYRRQLLDTSLALIQQSPWLGVPNYAAQMQSLRQGEGIIDIVNSYIFILLDAGIVGLLLYVLPYLIVVNRLITASLPQPGDAPRGSGRFAMVFVALILGCLFAIFTSSTFGIMRLLLTLLLALPTAWLGLTPEARDETSTATDLELDIPQDPLRGRRVWAAGRVS